MKWGVVTCFDIRVIKIIFDLGISGVINVLIHF